MKHIHTPQDFQAMLEADKAVLFLSFPWSGHSGKSQAVMTEWQRQAHFPVYYLEPDGCSFTWLWLDTIFGDEPETERTRGVVLWLQKGVVTAVVPDAGVAGTKTLARVTSDCFVSGKTHTRDSIVSLQNEPAAFDVELLKILCCPETHQALALADAAALDKVNERFAAGRLQTRGGKPVRQRIEDGLVRADRRYLYPMRRNIPILLVDEAIPLAQ